jgi:hypothetical protein
MTNPRRSHSTGFLPSILTTIAAALVGLLALPANARAQVDFRLLHSFLR